MARSQESRLLPILQNVVAYRLANQGVARLRTNEWQTICAKFDELSEELNQAILDFGRAFEIWSDECILLLPPATFVWLDEFKEDFVRACPETDLATIDSFLTLTGELSQTQEQVIFEGFRSKPEADKPTDQQDNSARHQHRLGTRTNILDPIINLAQKAAVDPSNAQSVWVALIELARDKERPAPLLGYADDEGVKYESNGDIKFLKLCNLRDRMRRKKGANTR